MTTPPIIYKRECINDFFGNIFFQELFMIFNQFLKEQESKGISLSVFIWGGVASELFLYSIGSLKNNFSYHDIEFCFLKDNLFYFDDSLVEEFAKTLKQNKFQIEDIGGLPIIKRIGVVSADTFQKNRFLLKDGDLWLNNIGVIFKNYLPYCLFILPSFFSPKWTLSEPKIIDMKDSNGLLTPWSLGRRIYRNISKSLRYELTTNLVFSDTYKDHIAILIKKFLRSIEIFSNEKQLDIDLFNKWSEENSIISLESGKKWIAHTVISESIKRLVVIHKSRFQDSNAFYIYYKEFLVNRFIQFYFEELEFNEFDHSFHDGCFQNTIQSIKKYLPSSKVEDLFPFLK